MLGFYRSNCSVLESSRDTWLVGSVYKSSQSVVDSQLSEFASAKRRVRYFPAVIDLDIYLQSQSDRGVELEHCRVRCTRRLSDFNLVAIGV